MTPRKCPYLIATVLALAGWGTLLHAENDVTVISTPATASEPPQKTADSDGTPVIHKSLHKKKTTTAQSIAATNTASGRGAPAASVPTVETGLPVARYPGMGTPIAGVSTYAQMPAPPVNSAAGAATRLPYLTSVFPSPANPATSPATAGYPPLISTANPSSGFVFTNFSKKKKNFYPWKTDIITTMFWIGEGSTPISSTTNVQSSWDEDWLPNNHGSDSPYNRNGYASGSHASTLNTFYVALPFNDLAFPEKAREWLPAGWYRRPKDGKQVSACKDRWVWIKNSRGRSCFAQWEDVGPLRYDHAEYVFGDERPTGMDGDHAGLDVSPAVADYLGIDGKNRITSWRFVDDQDVPPGPWLLLDEQAVLYTALEQQLKHSRSSSNLPIQRSTEPIDDPNIDSNKKKVDQSKG
ncbi:MAG TPA: hypothetical protein VGZ93_09495 [Candidatus Methylacidiphilales bacterium]|jgi:hypothetical protein|nr:hypothetical protein [Candidatus Methylacidiphilales bacterium]